MNQKFVVPTLLGLESFVADELSYNQLQNVKSENGRVFFEGDWGSMVRANLVTSCGERVMLVMGDFETHSFDDLFEKTKALPWEHYIGSLDAFPVSGNSLDSDLRSVPDLQKIIKKSIVERLKKAYKVEWFQETGSKHAVEFRLFKNRMLLCLDTSGYSLHKRGYRKDSNDAPLRETIAAAMVNMAWVHSDSCVCDPMCGSGTLAIEAALHAANIAPGLYRHFEAENWDCVPKRAFSEERERSISKIKKDISFTCFASDIDPNAIVLTKENAKKAHVDHLIHIEQKDIKVFKPDFCDFSINKKAIVLCNPPYGERLLDTSEARKLYKTIGTVFKPQEGYSYCLISPEPEFEMLFGRDADKTRKIFNGSLKCNFYLYLENKRKKK